MYIYVYIESRVIVRLIAWAERSRVVKLESQEYILSSIMFLFFRFFIEKGILRTVHVEFL